MSPLSILPHNIEQTLLVNGLKAVEKVLEKPKTWQDTPEWTGPRLYKNRAEALEPEEREENFGVGSTG